MSQSRRNLCVTSSGSTSTNSSRPNDEVSSPSQIENENNNDLNFDIFNAPPATHTTTILRPRKRRLTSDPMITQQARKEKKWQNACVPPPLELVENDVDDTKPRTYKPLRMKCTHCTGVFSKTNNLYAHIRAQHDYKQCPYCPKKLHCMATFVYHVRTHTGEKPYYCPVKGCDFRNAVKYNLKVHLASQRHGGKSNLQKYADVLDLDVCDESLQKRKVDSRVHELRNPRPNKRRRIDVDTNGKPRRKQRADYSNLAHIILNLNNANQASVAPLSSQSSSELMPHLINTSDDSSSGSTDEINTGASVTSSQIQTAALQQGHALLEFRETKIDVKNFESELQDANALSRSLVGIPFHLQPDMSGLRANTAMPCQHIKKGSPTQGGTVLQINMLDGTHEKQPVFFLPPPLLFSIPDDQELGVSDGGNQRPPALSLPLLDEDSNP